MDKDGKRYTKAEFMKFYSGTSAWDEAATAQQLERSFDSVATPKRTATSGSAKRKAARERAAAEAAAAAKAGVI